LTRSRIHYKDYANVVCNWMSNKQIRYGEINSQEAKCLGS